MMTVIWAKLTFWLMKWHKSKKTNVYFNSYEVHVRMYACTKVLACIYVHLKLPWRMISGKRCRCKNAQPLMYKSKKEGSVWPSGNRLFVFFSSFFFSHKQVLLRVFFLSFISIFIFFPSWISYVRMLLLILPIRTFTFGH